MQRLSDEWRDGNAPSTPPPLPSHKPSRSKKTPKPTQLEAIAAQTYRPAEGERIIPFISPPWRKTAHDLRGKLTIRGATPNVTKEKAAKAHNTRIRTLITNPTHLLMYSDGSMLDETNNKKNVGWGVVGYHNSREVITRRGGMGHTAEVYDAELTGLVVAAQEAIRHTQHNPVIKHVHIFADNTAAVTSVFEPKTAPGQYNMRTFNKIVTEFLDKDPTHTVIVEWCPGHTDVKGNERADAEAKAGALLWQTRFVTMTHAMRTSKAKILTRWTDEWNRTPPTGGFGIANRFPPAWKIREHVKSTKREVFSRITQCRTKHAFIGEYYSRFVPTEPIGCPCGEDIQTREHIIKHCRRYTEHRPILSEHSPELDLQDILGTHKGLEALAQFLQKSGAFTKTGNPGNAPNPPSIEDEANDVNDEAVEHWWDRLDRGRREAEEEEREQEEDTDTEDEEE
ncbi:hypothetical protein D9615_005656 [Tricholomella constricta]|nr:hypothetical protein D9615_005656 [Tricholomella constricta]